MAEIDTFCFGDPDWFAGPPIVDGLVDYDFLPVNALDPNEPGYIFGGRLTYAGGGLSSVIFQGVHRTSPDRLVLGFMARFATGFDQRDTILIALRGAFNSDSPTRAILIKPNPSAAGVEPGPGDTTAHIKRNVPPVGNQLDVWEFSGGNWSQTSIPADMEVKLRSWEPERPDGSPDEAAWSVEVSVPRVAAGGWIALNDSFGLYFDVIRTVNNAAAHSTFPTEAGPPPSDEPGVPGFAIPKWGRGLIPAVQNPVGSNTGLGVRFKNGQMGVGRRDLGSASTTLNTTINGKLGPPALTDNEIVAIVENTSPNAANDITAEFRFNNYGLGSPDFEAWSKVAGLNPNPTPRRVGVPPPPLDPPVDLAATADPTMPTSAVLFSPWKRIDVPLEYDDHPDQCMWVQLDSAGGANFTQAAVRRNMHFTHFSTIERPVEISGVGYPEPADGSGEHDFIIQTFCRKINLLELVHEKEIQPELRAIVEGTLATLGDAGPLGGGIVDNPAVGSPVVGVLPVDGPVTAQPSSATAPPPKDKWKNSVVYVWMAQGYRRTGTFIRLADKLYENLDSSPGEFVISAYHLGLQDPFHYAFEGTGLVQYAPGVYGIKVPHKGTIEIKVKLGATPGATPGDHSELPKATLDPPKPVDDGYGPDTDLPKGCLAMLMGMFGKKS